MDQDGGTEPTWDCDVEMRVVDHHELWIECYDHDAIGSDDLIGKCKLSLLPVFKRGLIDTWVTIKEETEWGKPKPVRSRRPVVYRRLHAVDARCL